MLLGDVGPAGTPCPSLIYYRRQYHTAIYIENHLIIEKKHYMRNTGNFDFVASQFDPRRQTLSVQLLL